MASPPEGEWSLDASDLVTFEEIGDGVTSVVFRGEWKGRTVAVKQMNSDPSMMSPKARLNMDRELTILQSVRHPNLVEFIGVLEQSASVSLVFEFCPGGSCFDILHGELMLYMTQKIKIARDVADAMEYLHSLEPPIIHRDLKSLNLLLMKAIEMSDDVPNVKVTDFGLSKMIDGAGGAVMTKNAGTCHWMAPEVFMSNSYDRKVDVYSFGMLLYEIICQDIPFGNVPATRLGLLVTKGKRPDLDLVPEDCPKSLRSLMCTCWAQEPDERPDFESVSAILGAIPL